MPAMSSAPRARSRWARRPMPRSSAPRREHHRDERSDGEHEEEHARAAVQFAGEVRADPRGLLVQDSVEAVDGREEEVVEAVDETLAGVDAVIGALDRPALGRAVVLPGRDQERQRPHGDRDDREDGQRTGKREPAPVRRLFGVGRLGVGRDGHRASASPPPPTTTTAAAAAAGSGPSVGSSAAPAIMRQPRRRPVPAALTRPPTSGSR